MLHQCQDRNVSAKFLTATSSCSALMCLILFTLLSCGRHQSDSATASDNIARTPVPDRTNNSTPHPDSPTNTQPPNSNDSGDESRSNDESPRRQLIEMVVQPYKVTCDASPSSLCFVIQWKDQDESQVLNEDIIGLNWQWGHEYQIAVSKQPIQYPTPDEPTMDYQLEKIMSDRLIGIHSEVDPDNTLAAPKFHLLLSYRYIRRVDRCEFMLPDQYHFLVDSEEVCEQLNLALNIGTELIGQMTFNLGSTPNLLLNAASENRHLYETAWNQLTLQWRVGNPNERSSDPPSTSTNSNDEPIVDTSCPYPAQFVIMKTGEISFSDCKSHYTQTISTEKIREVDRLTKRLTYANLNWAPQCRPSWRAKKMAPDEIRFIDIEPSNTEKKRLYSLNKEKGECWKGETQYVFKLKDKIEELLKGLLSSSSNSSETVR